jgi:hypothetical protein
MCASGTIGTAPSIVASAISTTSCGALGLENIRLDPQCRQKLRVVPFPAVYPVTAPSPSSQRNADRGTLASVAKAAPWNFRHIEQWQCATPGRNSVISNLTLAHRQLPRYGLCIFAPPIVSGTRARRAGPYSPPAG